MAIERARIRPHSLPESVPGTLRSLCVEFASTPTRYYFIVALLPWLLITAGLRGQSRVDAIGDPLPNGAIARIGTTRMRHFSGRLRESVGIGCIAWSPDGKMIATTDFVREGWGVQARVWEAATGKAAGTLKNKEHYGPTFIRFTPDSKKLAGTVGHTILLWDVATGAELERFDGHTDNVENLMFLDKGRTMLSVSRDGVVHWRNVVDREIVRKWSLFTKGPMDKSEIHHACFSLDGKLLAVEERRSTERKMKPQVETAIVVFDVTNRRELWREDARGHSCYFAFAADGKRLAIAAARLSLRDAANGRQLAVLKHNLRLADNSAEMHLSDHQDCFSPYGICFAPNGQMLAIRSFGRVLFWSSNDENNVAEYQLPDSGTCPVFSPDGTRVAVSSMMTFRILDAATRKAAVHWPSYEPSMYRFDTLTFSTDGRRSRQSVCKPRSGGYPCLGAFHSDAVDIAGSVGHLGQ